MTSTEMSTNRLRNNLIACIHAGLLYRNPHGVSDEMLAAAVEAYDKRFNDFEETVLAYREAIGNVKGGE